MLRVEEFTCRLQVVRFTGEHMSFRIFLIVVAVQLASLTAAATDEFDTAPTPSWVTTRSIDYTELFEDGSSSGAQLLLSDQQQNFSLAVPEFYDRQVIRLQSFGAVNQNPSLPITFFPEFQTLTIHELSIWRNGERRDTLANSGYQVSRQESVGPVKMVREISLSLFVMDLRGEMCWSSLTASGVKGRIFWGASWGV